MGRGDRLLSSVCRANKRDGSPCTAPATGANGFCWAHDPANSEQGGYRVAAHLL
jgi:hypothetical protein